MCDNSAQTYSSQYNNTTLKMDLHVSLATKYVKSRFNYCGTDGAKNNT